MNRLTWYPEKRRPGNYGKQGPDLAFIRLPLSSVAAIKAKKSFYDLTQDRSLQASTSDGPLAILGSPEKCFDLHPLAHGSEQFVIAKILTLLSDFEATDIREEWDFLDVKLYPEPEPSPLPDSFGGLSGSPVFRFPKTKDLRFEEWPKVEPVLAGVVFWQERLDSQTRSLRAHGPISIYNTFLRQLRNWIP